METGAASLAGKEGPSLSVRRRTVPLVTVIVINYNGRPFLDELLQTLGSFETLLIDNASSDGSLPYLRERFPWVQLLPQPVNLGFSRAANRGADRSTAPYLAFLNPDVKLEPSWLEELVAVAKSNRQVAAVASKMRFYDRPDILNGVGGSMNYLGYTWDRGMNECDRGQYDTVQEVLFASAGAALFRRDIFREGTVKLTDLRTYSAPWTLHKLLILRSSADRFRLQNPRILLNLTVPGGPVFIETLVTKLAVETLDEGILNRLSRSNEVQRDAILLGPEP